MKQMKHLKNLTPYNRNFMKFPKIHLTANGYEITAVMRDGRTIVLREDGIIKVD